MALNNAGSDWGCWISFYARTESSATDGTGKGGASMFLISVTRVGYLPSVPIPGTLLLLAPGLAALALIRRKRSGRF